MSASERMKKYLSDQLIFMSENHSLSRISVSSLCSASSINRGTFYYHFLDMEDLINWTFHDRVMGPIQKGIKEGVYMKGDVSRDILVRIYRNKDFFGQAIKLNGQNNLRDFMLKECITNWDLLLDNILINLGTSREAMTPVQREHLSSILNYFCYGHYYAALKWMIDGMNLDPIELAALIDSAANKGILPSIKDLIDLL